MNQYEHGTNTMVESSRPLSIGPDAAVDIRRRSNGNGGLTTRGQPGW